MKVNYHTHTYRCKHAGGTEEDYTLAAIENDVKILGFSDHGPFPDKDYGLRMDYSELEEYITEINRLKEIYSDKITLYKGLEIEYFKKSINYYEDLLTNKGLDYLILGEHQYYLEDGTHKNIFFADNTEWYIEYANAISEGLSTGYFKILAHPDVCMINSLPWDSNCDKAFDIILNAVSKYDTILEFNANGLRRGISDFPDGKRYPYPHKKLWQCVKDTNIKVTVGSDCHNPKNIWDQALDSSYKILNDLQIPTIENIF